MSETPVSPEELGIKPQGGEAFEAPKKPVNPSDTLKTPTLEPKTPDYDPFVSPEEFEQMQKEKNEIVSSFVFDVAGARDTRATFYNHNGNGWISAVFPFDIRERIPTEIQDQFEISPDGRHIIYPKQFAEEAQQHTSNEQRAPTDIQKNYFLTEHPKAYPFPPNDEALKDMEVSTTKLARELKDLSGNEIVINAGAGISRGGEKPIWSLQDLQQRLGLNSLDDFLQKLSHNPELLTEDFTGFISLFSEKSSSPAHRAIAELVRMKPGVTVLTSNGDLKFESEGIRAIHYHMAPDTFDEIKDRTQNAKVMLSIGADKDDTAIMAYIKDRNPNFKVVAFTLPPSETVRLPTFLDEEDQVIFGDCQELLPQVVEQMSSLPEGVSEQSTQSRKSTETDNKGEREAYPARPNILTLEVSDKMQLPEGLNDFIRGKFYDAQLLCLGIPEAKLNLKYSQDREKRVEGIDVDVPPQYSAFLQERLKTYIETGRIIPAPDMSENKDSSPQK